MNVSVIRMREGVRCRGVEEGGGVREGCAEGLAYVTSGKRVKE